MREAGPGGLFCACVIQILQFLLCIWCASLIPADTRHLHHLGLFQACRVLPCPPLPALSAPALPSSLQTALSLPFRIKTH